MPRNLFDPLLLRTARSQVKAAFVDPATVSGQGGMPPGGDPAQGGMPPGGDPAQGGMPPGAAPGAADVNAQLAMQSAGAGGLTEDRVMQLIQGAMQGGGAGGAGATGPNGQPKKKVDINTEIYQIKKLLIYLLQLQGATVPPEMMLGDPADDPQAAPGEAASDPASAGAVPGAQQSAIPPMKSMGAANPALAGGGGGALKQSEFLNRGSVIAPSFLDTVNQASGLAALIRRANSVN